MPPTFIFKPQSKKVFEGDTARLECQISAIPTPRIYWKRNNEMVQYNTDRIRYPTDEFWWVGHWCVRKQQPVFAESNVNGLVPKSSRLESWICPSCVTQGAQHWVLGRHSAESLALGAQRGRAVPRCSSEWSSSRGPMEKHSFRNEMCSVGISKLMPPAGCQDVNHWWL